MLITSSEIDLKNKIVEEDNLSGRTLVKSPKFSKSSPDTGENMNKISSKYLRIMQTQTSFIVDDDSSKNEHEDLAQCKFQALIQANGKPVQDSQEQLVSFDCQNFN